MKIKFKPELLILLVPVLFLASSLSFIETEKTQDVGSTTIEYHSNVCVWKNGVLLGCTPNVLTNTGKDLIKDYIGGAAAGAKVDFIGISNGTPPAAGSTTLNNEITTCGFARAAGSYVSRSESNGNWSFSKVFTSTCNSILVNTTGIFNASSAGVLFAGNTFTDATLQSNDQLNVTWFIWIV